MPPFRRAFAGLLAGLAFPLAMAQPAPAAGPYPTRPVRLLVGYAAGGGTDVIARIVAQSLSPRWGQQVLVENKAGASGMIAAEAAARAPADGYTLLLAASSIGTAPLLYEKVGYDAIKSFAPVTQVASVVHILAINPKLPVKNVGELLAYARQNPGKLNYGSTGMGTSTHL